MSKKKKKGNPVGVAAMWGFLRSQVSSGLINSYDSKTSPYPQCSIALEKLGHPNLHGSYKRHCTDFREVIHANAAGFKAKKPQTNNWHKIAKSIQESHRYQKTADVSSADFLQTYEWRKLRMEALKKYGPVCQCCGASKETGAVMNVDHIKPRKLFPQLALDINNLQVLCHECNHGKGNWDMTDWRNLDENQKEHLKSI